MVGQDLRDFEIASADAGKELVGDLGLDSLLEVEQLRFSDRLVEQIPRDVCQSIAFFLGDEGLTVIRPECRQALLRSDATNCSIFCELT